jgi:hypothetical protein
LYMPISLDVLIFYSKLSFMHTKNILPNIRSFTIGISLALILNIFASRAYCQESPRYRRGAYAGESFQISNEHLYINIYKRPEGWGWAEIFTSSGKLMAVLDHLGEIMFRDQDIPARFAATDYSIETTANGQSVIFKVESVVIREKLKGTSFDEWMRYPYTEPAIKGIVTITLADNDPMINLSYHLEATGNYYARYVRGPWLKVGEASFGTAKNDAILPGVEWAIDDEWTSGSDWFKDPWALRVAPHPNMIAIPMMTLSHDGVAISLSWNPRQVATRWFNYRDHVQQAVFAAPNFIDRMNNNIMGLMVPDATIEGHQNEVYATQPLELKIGQRIHFDADVWFSKGNSLDAVVDWVKINGLPEPPEPKWPYRETLDRIANAYNTNFWHEGSGFGIIQRPEHPVRPNIPSFLPRYIKDNKGSELAIELEEKIKWSRTQIKEQSEKDKTKSLLEKGETLLKLQKDDGSFRFDPHGWHYRKDDFIVAASIVEPMGLKNDTALEIVLSPALELLDIYNVSQKQKFADAARKAFDFCLHFQRPDGGDFWETPIHAANLLAAGNAAIGYYEAYKIFNDKRYLDKSIYFIRSVIPFTHLWEPADVEMLYNTKPVFSSSDWYFANWVRDHVQWEVLSVLAKSSARGIFWADIDPEIDWDRFHQGITLAAVRWLNLQEERKWRPHNIPETYEAYLNGDFDYCYPDTHNSITGNYGGMFILPNPIALNIYAVLDRMEMIEKRNSEKDNE